MSFIAHKLKHRAQILKSENEPNPTSGGFDRSYTQLTRIWCGLKVINEQSIVSGTSNVRGQNISLIDTHEFLMRYSSVIGTIIGSTQGLSRAFSSGFSKGFDSILDTDPIKREYFLFLEDGGGNTQRGRLFRINRVIRDENYKKYFRIKATQLEEQGTGFQA